MSNITILIRVILNLNLELHFVHNHYSNFLVCHRGSSGVRRSPFAHSFAIHFFHFG